MGHGASLRGPREVVAGGEVSEPLGGDGKVGVLAPDDAEGAPASGGVKVKPGDRRGGWGLACDLRHQPDAELSATAGGGAGGPGGGGPPGRGPGRPPAAPGPGGRTRVPGRFALRRDEPPS